jgi:hypothetical protein
MAAISTVGFMVRVTMDFMMEVPLTGMSGKTMCAATVA